MPQKEPSRPDSRPKTDPARKTPPEGAENVSNETFPAKSVAEKRIRREKRRRTLSRTPQTEPSPSNSWPKAAPARKHATGLPACGLRITVRIADCMRISKHGRMTGLRINTVPNLSQNRSTIVPTSSQNAVKAISSLGVRSPCAHALQYIQHYLVLFISAFLHTLHLHC